MFGHTFLRIDSSLNSKLLSYAINYAAQADGSTENGFIFAIKGLFGGYYGKYSLLPYYEKLKEYRDTEQRDIFEYDLNLTYDEIIMMLRHIWEIKDTYSNYYFFDENCSYNILWLLEIARESLNLRDYFTYQVSPPETLFAVKEENLIKNKQYRASKRTKILTYKLKIKDKYLSLVKQLSLNEILPKDVLHKDISLQQKQFIFEAAIELTEYNYIENRLSKKEYIKIFYSLSKARATLKKGKKLKIKKISNPLDGHRAIKTTIQSQYSDTGLSYLFGIRAAYHSLDDSDIGFLKGTEIRFLDTLFHYKDNSLYLDQLTLLSIVSLSQIDVFFTPMSWRTKFIFDRNKLDDTLLFNGSIGTGISFNIYKENFLYLLSDFTTYENKDLSIGVSIGAILYQKDNFKTNIELTQKIYSDKNKQFLTSFIQSYRVKQNINLQLKYNYVQKLTKDKNHLNLSLNLFF